MKTIIAIGIGLFIGWQTTMPNVAKRLQETVLDIASRLALEVMNPTIPGPTGNSTVRYRDTRI